VIGRNYPTQIALVSDAATTLNHMCEMLDVKKTGSQWNHSFISKTDDNFYNDPELRVKECVPVTGFHGMAVIY